MERVDNLIVIGDKTFKNWSEAKAFAKTLYDKYKFEGNVLFEEDKDFFTESLKLRGARGLEKIGCGINKIFVKTNSYGKNSLWIERIDGSMTDFSYIKCFIRKSDNVKITQHELDVKKSARNAIHKYIKGLKIERNQYGDAHHSDITFDQLFNNWISENNIDVENIEVGGHCDGEEEIYFVDKDVEKSFVEYHNTHASIEVLSPDYHRHLKKQ